MSRLRVMAAPPSSFGWIASRTGCVPTSNATAIAAIGPDGLVRGMVLYEKWTPNSVQAHMAVDSPIVWRSLVGPAFAYPFEQCGKSLLIAVVPSHNVRSCALVRRFGFTESHRIRDGWETGDDLVMFEMRKEQCRFIGQNRKAA